LRNRNLNLQTSKAPPEIQAQGTSLFTSAGAYSRALIRNNQNDKADSHRVASHFKALYCSVDFTNLDAIVNREIPHIDRQRQTCGQTGRQKRRHLFQAQT